MAGDNKDYQMEQKMKDNPLGVEAVGPGKFAARGKEMIMEEIKQLNISLTGEIDMFDRDSEVDIVTITYENPGMRVVELEQVAEHFVKVGGWSSMSWHIDDPEIVYTFKA